MAPKWPQVNNGPEHINEHATYLKEVCSQLQAVDRGRHNQVPWNVVQTYLDSTLVLIGKVLRQPALREILQQVKDAAKCTQNIQHDVTIIKNSVGVSTTAPTTANFGRGRPSAGTWAEVAARGKGAPLPPPPTPGNHPQTRTGPAITAYKDRAVTVKLKNSSITERYRTHSPTWVRQQVITATQNNAGTKLVKVVAAYQLKSGDIQIFTSTTAEAATLKENSRWLGGLGEHAEVVVPTYGVIVHGIPTNSINVNDQRATIEQILADNHTVIPRAKISHVGWLTKEGTLKRASSIVVEFTDPRMANATIYAGLAWEGQIHQCQLYDRACRIKQCFRCYNYGHITTQCNASQVCGYCAEHHETKHCRRRGVEGFTPRCAVCKDSHTAWSNACPARKKETERIERAKDARSIYWHVPTKDTPAERTTQRTEDPTTVISEPGTSHAREPTRQLQPAGTLGTTGTTGIQILVTPPAGEEEEVHPDQQAEGASQIDQRRNTQPHGALDPSLNAEIGQTSEQYTSIYPLEGLEGLAMQEADGWLAGLDHADEGDWLNTITVNTQGEPEPSPLTSMATDPRTTQGALYKPCKCPEHQDIYSDWPTEDAELIIAKCMRTCMYCGKEVHFAADLRKHINNSNIYTDRNLKAVAGPVGGKQLTLTPGWVRRENTERTGSRRRAQRAWNNTLTDSTNVAPRS
jgi:hypothetical protein